MSRRAPLPASLKSVTSLAVISTPLDAQGHAHPQSLCNGGLIGDDRVLSIDAYYSPEGAAWVNAMKRLFGKPVTDVICAHLDHTGGLSGFREGARGPEIYMTAKTWGLMTGQYSAGRPVEGTPFLAPPARLVGPTRIIADDSPPLLWTWADAALPCCLSRVTPSDLRFSSTMHP